MTMKFIIFRELALTVTSAVLGIVFIVINKF